MHMRITIPEGGLFTSETILSAAQGAAVGGVGLPLVGNAALRATGFTGGGITGGRDIAAVIHSGIGNVAKGSLFAMG